MRKKAISKDIYWLFEDDPVFAFEFSLAEALHKTVREIRKMDEWEFAAWSIYFARREQQRELAEKKGN